MRWWDKMSQLVAKVEFKATARDARVILAAIGGMVAIGAAVQGCARSPIDAIDSSFTLSGLVFSGLLLLVSGWAVYFLVSAYREWRRWQGPISVIAIAASSAVFLSCASLPPGAGKQARNLTCAAARVELQRCDAGTEANADACAYARVIASVCDAAVIPEEESLFASAGPSYPGAGFHPRSAATYWRDYPGGPERHGIGDPSIDPWAISCATKTGPNLAACLRSRYLEASPAVCDAYRRAFGVTTCGSPGGGWSRGPSNERWGAAREALNYFCENDPSFIGSVGRSGGLDCESTGYEWAALGAFGAEYVVDEYSRRTQGPPPPPLCPNGRIDPGETCSNCPADVGPCAPPPPPDPRLDCSSLAIPAPEAPRFVGVSTGTASTGLAGYRLVECRNGSVPVPPAPRPKLSAETRATLAKLCGWFRNTQRRSACASAVAEVLGIDAIDARLALEDEP